MDDKRKNAYLHLMYRAFTVIRFYSSTYCQRKLSRLNPFRWIKLYRNLKKINELADAFHNLPLLLKSDNAFFDEDMFWRFIETYEKQFNIHEEGSYKSIFNEAVKGENKS